MNKIKLQLIDKLCIFGLVYFIGVFSAMYFCYKQPIDEHTNIYNRYLNWPESNCYSQSDVELIIFGELIKIK
tara:strand:- start:218 stop:433 length:216 start_codon:yes stop_codon:yes gene_type:complete